MTSTSTRVEVTEEAAGDVDHGPANVLRSVVASSGLGDPRSHAEQLARLVYLTNLLLTAGRPDGAPYLPVDAADAVLSHAALAARTASCTDDDAEARVAALQRVGVDGLFRLGWRLHADATAHS